MRRLRRCERGITLTELLVSMSIMGFVMGAVVVLFTSGSTAEAQLNLRFQAQSEARVALEALRRDVHNSCSATVTGGTAVTLYTIDSAAVSYPCTVVGSTWCTFGSGTRFTLHRNAGATTCSGSAQRRADFITAGSVFSVQTAVGELPKVAIDMIVNREPAVTRLGYRLDDAIALRNARRV